VCEDRAVSDSARPALSIVIPARDGIAEVEALLPPLLADAATVDAEVVVVGGPPAPAPAGVAFHPLAEADLWRLRLEAVRRARGEVVAVGEDHAVPEPGWSQAVLDAHARNPEAAAVVGGLVNATDATVAGRANFLSFTSPWQAPLNELPSRRPPPVSTLSFKREILAGLEHPGDLETDLMPRLFNEGRMVAAPDVRVLHYQDHGLVWPVRNGFWNCRTAYGYARSRMDARHRRDVMRWALTRGAREHFAEAVEGSRGMTSRARELAVVAVIVAATALGTVAGLLTGPGRAPELTA
jgi:hypothetical protein